MLTKKQQIIKRIFDVFFAFAGLIITFLPQLFLIFIATLSFGNFGIFSQFRVGYKGKTFKIYKIRSMKNEFLDFTSTLKPDKLTKFSKILRKYKIDELPQLWNVLMGHMSVVGPRPDILGYADKLKGEDRIILEVKPGLTGLATLKFFNENVLLEKQENPKKYNDEVIWKQKIELNKKYVKNYSFYSDLKIILKTIGLVMNKFSS